MLERVFYGGLTMKKYFSIDFENDNYGICIPAKSEEEARKIAENPKNWKDGKKRIISYIREDN